MEVERQRVREFSLVVKLKHCCETCLRTHVLIDANRFVRDCEIIGCDLISCLECMSSTCHMSREIANSVFNQPSVCTPTIL
jgi:hypothetical protein